MNRALKKLSATVLAATMLLSFIPTAYAEKADNDQMSTFDFGASDYAFEENDGTATITIKRDGTGNAATKVVVKVADLVSDYGVDYEILDGKGKPYAKVDGTKPDPADFVFKETGEEDEEIAAITGEASQTETTVTDNVKAAVEEQIESIEVPDSTKTVTKHDTGSNLLDAQADYLGLPGNTTTEEVEDETKQILDELYDYYNKAQGAECVVNFGLGETEKEITIKINDNDQPNSQKIFSLCLMATDNEFTTIAPNATTYVTIQDDEETQQSDYAIVEDDIRLTSANPTATVTIKRTGGEMYFSTVELSTVTLTAPEGSYEALDNKAVAFVPGQTEATVEIKALDFLQGGTFGLRLDEDCDIDTLSDHYANVTIVKNSTDIRERTAEEMKDLESSSAQLETETLSDKGTVYGSSQTTIRIANPAKENGPNGSNLSGGWGSDDTIWMNRSWTWGRLAIYEKNAIGLAGINKLSSSLSSFGGPGWTYHTVSPTIGGTSGADDNNSTKADSGGRWKDVSYSIDVSNKYDWEYLAVAIGSGGSPTESANTALFSRTFKADWQKYTFDSQKSAVSFTRPIYDFINGTPNVVYTYYDGEKTKNYFPSAVKVTDSNGGWGNQVGGFYANSGKTVYIHSANWQNESKKGLYLKGVYFVNSSKTAREMGDGTKYDPSGNYYYQAVVSAKGDDPYVRITLDESFVKTLADHGVVSSSSSNIKIFPVYEQRDIELNFFNADYPSGGYGKYDASHRYSEISNIYEASQKKNGALSWSKVSSGKSDVYRTWIPSGSILRMGVNASNKRIPNGVCISEKCNGYKTSHIWFKPDSTIYDEVSPNGTKITNADYTKAETVVMTPLDIYPVTDSQGISITYLANEAIPDVYKGTRTANGKKYTGLEMSVVETETMSSTNPKGVDKNGKYQNNDAYTGMEYSFTAIAPEGYVTEWKNLVGDTNGDGYIDEKELKERRRVTDSPAQVYGDVYAGKIDSDRVSLVYHFIPKTSLLNTRERTGNISRSNANFLQVLNNVKWSTSSPIPSAMVNLGGDTANTDYQGNFKIDSKLPALGNANLVVTTLDGSNFYTTVDLSQHSPVVLPALEEFNALDLSATLTYKGKTNTIQMTKQEGVISVYDGSCTVYIAVDSNSVILPAKAHFFITDNEGNIVVECDKDTTNYKTTNTKTGSKLESKLTFNPKKDCYANYQLWVQFEDEGGKTYGKINTGLVFSKPLTIDEFLFPMIGSSGLEDFYRSDFVSDLIGDPLGDIGIDALPLEINERRYSPSSLSPEAQERMNWTQYSYSYAWGKDFKIVDKKWGNKKDDKKSSDTDTGSGNDSSGEDSDTESEDSDTDELTSTDSDGWEVIDKNKKTSGDNDDGKSKLDKDAEGNDMTVNVEPDTAMPTENIEDYDVTVTEDGRMYLFWAEKDKETGTCAQINAAYFIGEGNDGTADWSNGVKLTNAGDGMYYTGIGGTVIGDTIKIGAVKSNFANDADNSLVFVNHVPYSEIMVKNLDCSTVYPMAGDVMTLTADVTNNGLKTYDGDVTVKFTIDNNEVATATANNIPGAQSVTVTATAESPDFEQYINIMAETTVDNFNTSSSITLNKETQLDIANEEINQYSDYADDEYYAYTAYVENIGNLDAKDVTFTVIDSNDKVLGTLALAELMAKQSEEVKVRFNVDNSMFDVDKDGVGSLDVYVNASYNDLESEAFGYTIMKQFDKDAIASLNSVTDVKFENGGKFTMNTNDEKDIQPTITGVEDGTLHVVWTETSNSEVAAFDSDGSVIAYEPGTATITGYLLPCKQNIVFDSYGNSIERSLLEDIPTDMLKKVTAEITVSGSADEDKGILGDLDKDTVITSADALMALRMSVNLEETTPERLTLGDIDSDGIITSSDALAILRYSVSLPTNDKIGKAIGA